MESLSLGYNVYICTIIVHLVIKWSINNYVCIIHTATDLCTVCIMVYVQCA